MINSVRDLMIIISLWYAEKTLKKWTIVPGINTEAPLINSLYKENQQVKADNSGRRNNRG